MTRESVDRLKAMTPDELTAWCDARREGPLDEHRLASLARQMRLIAEADSRIAAPIVLDDSAPDLDWLQLEGVA
ncbi:MAG: hypothetical protein ABSB52_14265 [Acidimicrobiales bacterium]|jgi:hypothetical protein